MSLQSTDLTQWLKYMNNGIIQFSLSERSEVKMLKAGLIVFWPPQSVRRFKKQ